MVIGICDHINFWAWHYKDMFQNKKYWNVLNQGSFVAFFYQRINFFCSCPIQCKSKRFSSISYLFFCSIALSKYLLLIFWQYHKTMRLYHTWKMHVQKGDIHKVTVPGVLVHYWCLSSAFRSKYRRQCTYLLYLLSSDRSTFSCVM